MSGFFPLATIRIEHSFYEGAPTGDLFVLPLAQTERVLQNAGLIIRNNPDGITLFYDRQKRETLAAFARDGEFTLYFKLVSTNPLFENFTELPGRREEALVFLTSARKVETGIWSLTREKFLGPRDLELDLADADDLASLTARAGIRDRMTPLPICLAAVSPLEGGTGQEDPEHRVYLIRFRRRQCIWKYLLLGKFAEPDFSVVDLDGRVNFSRKPDEPMTAGGSVGSRPAGCRFAGVVESDTPLPLGGPDAFRFQLRKENGKSERIMVPRLPLAPLDRINMRVTPDNTKEFFSEIFINP